MRTVQETKSYKDRQTQEQMKFTKNSGLVKTWVSLVLTGVYTREQVPNLFNLRAVVGECLDALEVG